MGLPGKRIAIITIAILLGVLFAVYILNQQGGASIYNYLPYIFGSGFFLGGVYIFLLAFRIYKPKFKTDEQQLKLDDALEKFGKLWKVCSIIMILYGSYNLIWHDPNMYGLKSQVEDNKWTNKDKATLIKTCMRDAGTTAKQYPKITLDYCTCAIDKIMKSMNREEYIENLSKSPEEQYKIDSPFIQGCVIISNRLIDSAEKQGK